MMKVNSWTHWQPLKQVVIGNCFDASFFEDVKDTKLRDSLQKIIYETKEDLDGIKKTFKDLGVDCIQIDSKWTNAAGVNPYKSFGEFLELSKEGNRSLVKPLIAPRDHYITLGDELFLINSYNPQIVKDGKHPLDMFECNLSLPYQMWENIDTKLGPFPPKKVDAKIVEEMWKDESSFDLNMKYNPIAFKQYIAYSYKYDAPNISRLGDTLLIDEDRNEGFDIWYNKIKPNHKHKKITKVDIGGHNDGSMCLPRPGLVIGAPWIEKGFFENTLPGWDQLIIENPNNFENQFPTEFAKFKNIKEDMLWYIDGEMENKPFTNFVDTYLKDWVGFMEESIFEVNMLSIDENTILSLNYQKEVNDKLKSVGIEPIYCRFRHRHFWDGGLHCLTVDTYREGECETYL